MFESHEPCIFTIFGSTGDLSYKKIFPALFHLHATHRLPSCFFVIAIGRREYTKTAYLESIKPFIEESDLYCIEKWNSFSNLIDYFKLDFNSKSDYLALDKYLNFIEKNHKTMNNRIFYFAVSPNYFEIISKNLSEAKLINSLDGFKRVVFEKPFGKDLKTAKHFNDILQTYFSEDQIYRIDHYLGKEIWCKNGIEKVHIKILETIGIEKRGSYYDQTGALRDMVQNHLLQILALVAIDPPINFDINSIKDSKVKVLNHLKKYTGSLVSSDIVLGQYEGYKEEFEVPKNSLTETYAFIPCEIDLPRWKGVPFILETGKKLNEKKAEIEIYFKPHSSAYSPNNKRVKQNKLIIKINPTEGIYLEMNAKKPGLDFDIDQVNMEYCHSCHSLSRSSDAYEKLITDIINGDSTRFARWDEIESAWSFIDQIIECCSLNKNMLETYKVSSKGPLKNA